MSIIFGLELALALFTLAIIVVFFALRSVNKDSKEPPISETDLKLVDRPELISKIPENETVVPDANSSDPYTKHG